MSGIRPGDASDNAMRETVRDARVQAARTLPLRRAGGRSCAIFNAAFALDYSSLIAYEKSDLWLNVTQPCGGLGCP